MHPGKAALQYCFADGAAAVVDGGEIDVDVVRVAGGRPAERVNGVRLAVQLNGRAFILFSWWSACRWRQLCRECGRY